MGLAGFNRARRQRAKQERDEKLQAFEKALKGMTAPQIVEYIQEQCGVELTTDGRKKGELVGEARAVFEKTLPELF